MLAQGGGSIINSASVLALSADEMLAAYTASKHAVLGLTRAIAATGSFAKGGIRCNCICPGDIRTPMVARYFAALPDPAAAEAATAAHYPTGRIAEPQEMADVVAFLVSDLSRFVNGAALVADGGMMARVY
jgi:NAD(P)-dependent dehydrogenase (short-subunit alcohol dehydrogenase family)